MSDFLLKKIEGRLHTKAALLIGYLVVLLFCVTLNPFLKDFIAKPEYRLIIYFATFVGWTGYWSYYTSYLPRNVKGKVGLVIAIFAESSHEELRLKNDLISQLAKSISSEGLSDLINIVVLKNHQSENIKNQKDIEGIHKKVCGHFYLYGQVKRRKNKEISYYLDLDGVVIHKPIDIQRKSELTQDFVTVLPKQISFFEATEFKGFEFTKHVVYLAVKYITGVAAFLSGDPHLAIRLHEHLEQEFQKIGDLTPGIKKIKEKARQLLAEEKLLVAVTLYRKGDPSFQNWLDQAFSINHNLYGGYLFRAVIEFQSNKAPEALKTIKQASKLSKSTFEWRYSEAFLYFWLEDYPKAFYCCTKISKQSYRGEYLTIADVEEFNIDLLQQYSSSKPQLYFWLGYINLKKKTNYPLALEYFEEFEKLSHKSMLFLKQRSLTYLAEIKKQMEL